MAIDSKAKRFSMMNFAGGYMLPLADGNFTGVDRAQLLGFYFGFDSGAATLTLRIKLGSVVLLATGAVAIPSSGSNVPWRIQGVLIVRSIGGSGTLMATGDADNGQTAGLLANTAAVTVDTTAGADLGVSAQWGQTSASNTITVQNLDIKKRG